MLRVCGIELKSSDAIAVVLALADDEVSLVASEPARLTIDDDESASKIKAYANNLNEFLRVHRIDVVVIKKRAKKGRMAGGAISFKLEALIQMNTLAEVVLLSPQAVAAAHKKEPFTTPPTLKVYQENAFMTAALYARRH